MSKKNKIVIGLILIILIVIVVLSISLKKQGLEPTSSQLIKLKLGGHTTIAGVILETAQDKGFFNEQGLDVEIERIESSKISMAGLENGELDIVIGSRSAGTFNYLAKDEKLRIIADAGRVTPVIIIRKDLKDSIKTLKDLKDKTFATPRQGSTSQYAFAKVLESVGLSLNDIISKSLKQQEAVTALETGNLDAGIINEPYATIAIDKGIGIRLGENEVEKLFPNGQQHMVLLITTNTLTDKANAVKKFFKAYKKAVDYYNKAKEGNQPERDEVIRIISNYTGIDSKIINKIVWIDIASNLKPDMAYLEEAQDWYFENGFLEQKVNLHEKVDLSFLP